MNVSASVQALPTFLLTKMIEIGFKNASSDESFERSVAYSWLAEVAAKSMAEEGLFNSIEKDIKAVLNLQEVAP